MNNPTNLIEIEELKNRCALLEQQNAELTAKVNWYEEQFRLSQQSVLVLPVKRLTRSIDPF